LLADVSDSCLALLTVILDDPTGYGRIIRDNNNQVVKIVEQKDATPEQLKINEGNTGILACKGHQLKDWLSRLSNHNAQNEYYLTDLPDKIGNAKIIDIDDEDEIYNVNSREQLEYAEKIMDKFI